MVYAKMDEQADLSVDVVTSEDDECVTVTFGGMMYTLEPIDAVRLGAMLVEYGTRQLEATRGDD